MKLVLLLEGHDRIVDDLLSKPKALTGNDHKNLNVNLIFKNKFSAKLRAKWFKFEEKYYKNGRLRDYGGSFFRVGMEIIDVPISDITPGQTGIDSNALKAILSGGDDHKPSSELPEAIRFVDGLVLVDGTHRVAAAILRGETTVRMSVKTSYFA